MGIENDQEIIIEDNEILKNKKKWAHTTKTMKKTSSNYKQSLSITEKNLDDLEISSKKLNKIITKLVNAFHSIIYALDSSSRHIDDDNQTINAKKMYDVASQSASNISRFGSKISETISQFIVRLNKAQIAEVHTKFAGKVSIS